MSTVRWNGLVRSKIGCSLQKKFVKHLEVVLRGQFDSSGKDFSSFTENVLKFRNLKTTQVETYLIPFVDIAISITEAIIGPFSMIYPGIKIYESDYEESVNFWSVLAVGGCWHTILKQRIAFIFAYYHKQKVLPVCDTTYGNCKFLVGRRLSKVINQKISRLGNRRGQVLLSTILNGIKRGMPVVDDSAVLKSLRDHREILSTEKGSVRRDLRDVIKRTAREIFQNINDDISDVKIGHSISQNSSFESSRKTQGAFGFVSDASIEEELLLSRRLATVYSEKLERLEDVYSNKLGILKQLKEYREYISEEASQSTITEKIEFNRVKTLFKNLPLHNYNDYERKFTFEFDLPLYGVDIESLYDSTLRSIKKRKDRKKKVQLSSSRKWSVQFIREPLKVRVLTKGPSGINGCFSDIQKKLFGCLNKYKQFSLTRGDYVGNHSDVLHERPSLRQNKQERKYYDINHKENIARLEIERLDELKKLSQSFDNVVSASNDIVLDNHKEKLIQEVNYSFKQKRIEEKPVFGPLIADVLYDPIEILPFHSLPQPRQEYGWASGDFKAATDNMKSDATLAVIEGLDDSEMKDLIYENLLNCVLEYPEVDGVKLDSCKMKNGQLMGSILSFPILCIINLACFRYVYEKRGCRKYAIEDLPVMVNGDDILFYTSKSFHDDWESTTKEVGLIPSIGKSYFSNEILMVNSRLMNCNGPDILDAVPFINMGLVTGRKKGEESDGLEKTLRQKMSKLSGALKDLDRDFNLKDKIEKDIYQNCIYEALNRKDITFSGFSKTHLGVFEGLIDYDSKEVEKFIRTELTLQYIRKRKEKTVYDSKNKVAFAALDFKDARVQTTWIDKDFKDQINYERFYELLSDYKRKHDDNLEEREGWSEVLNALLGSCFDQDDYSETKGFGYKTNVFGGHLCGVFD